MAGILSINLFFFHKAECQLGFIHTRLYSRESVFFQDRQHVVYCINKFMNKFCTYMTFYLGKVLPPFYIGSTTVLRIKKGYHGSPSSVQYSELWKSEVKNNPQLFKTFIIDYSNEMAQKLENEYKWQKTFNVVDDPLFVNMAFATKKMIPNPQGVAKALHTKKQRNRLAHTPQTKEKIRQAALKRAPITEETRKKMQEASKNKTISAETRQKMRESRLKNKKPMTEEAKRKISESKKGKKSCPVAVAKRSAKLRGRKHSQESKQHMSAAQKGRKLSREHKQKLSQTNIGKKWFTNEVIDRRCYESPGPEWRAGRLSGQKNVGSNNKNATNVIYMGKTYMTLLDAISATGLSRHLLLKNGAVFKNSSKRRMKNHSP